MSARHNNILIKLTRNMGKKFDQEEKALSARTVQYIDHRPSSLPPPCVFVRSLGLFTCSSCSQGIPSFFVSIANVIVPEPRLGHGFLMDRFRSNIQSRVSTRGGYPNDPRNSTRAMGFFHLVGRRRAHTSTRRV